jgi:hypothetical protein
MRTIIRLGIEVSKLKASVYRKILRSKGVTLTLRNGNTYELNTRWVSSASSHLQFVDKNTLDVLMYDLDTNRSLHGIVADANFFRNIKKWRFFEGIVRGYESTVLAILSKSPVRYMGEEVKVVDVRIDNTGMYTIFKDYSNKTRSSYHDGYSRSLWIEHSKTTK